MPLGFELERRIGGWWGGGALYVSADAMSAEMGTQEEEELMQG